MIQEVLREAWNAPTPSFPLSNAPGFSRAWRRDHALQLGNGE